MFKRETGNFKNIKTEMSAILSKDFENLLDFHFYPLKIIVLNKKNYY